MSTRSIICIDDKTKMGFYKHSDGYPTWTVPQILAYITIYGYEKFVSECNRIAKLGGCSCFFYPYVDTNYEENEYSKRSDMLAMLQAHGALSNSEYKEDESNAKWNSEEWGYVVLPTEIKILYCWKNRETSIHYNTANFHNLIVAGIFEDDIADRFDKIYHLETMEK